MNFMNFMNQFSGYWHLLKIFFLFGLCYPLFHVHFASCGSFICICEAVAMVLGLYTLHFMNFMKVYEEGSFMANFWNLVFCYGDFMNMEKGLTSYMFINPLPCPAWGGDWS